MMLCLLLTGMQFVQAQVTVDVKIDSLELLVGEQTGVTVDVSCDAGARVEWPALKRGTMVVPGVELIDVLPADTQQLNDGKRLLISRASRRMCISRELSRLQRILISR